MYKYEIIFYRGQCTCVLQIMSKTAPSNLLGSTPTIPSKFFQPLAMIASWYYFRYGISQSAEAKVSVYIVLNKPCLHWKSIGMYIYAAHYKRRSRALITNDRN